MHPKLHKYYMLFKTLNKVQSSLTLLYLTLVLVTIVVCGIVAIHITEHTFTTLEEQLQYVNGLVERSTSEILNHNESVMALIGHHVFHNDRLPGLHVIKKELEHLVNLNSSIIAIGLSQINGQLVVVTHTNDDAILPNLYDIPVANISFKETVESDKMIIGDTYFAPMIKYSNGGWLVPLRLKIIDVNNKIKEKEVVVSLGISTSSHISNWGTIGDLEDIHIDILSHDGLLQFSNNINGLFGEVILDPVILSNLVQNKLQRYFFTPNNESLAYISYDGEFKLYTIISVDGASLFVLMVDDFLSLGIVFIISLFILTALYIWICTVTKKHDRALTYQATHDNLTGFPNRYYLMDEIDRRILHANKNKTAFAVLYLDLDDFKNVNDTYSHAIGDILLTDVANRFQQAIRGNDFVARIGGDEFVIISDEFDTQSAYYNEKREHVSLQSLAKRIQAVLKDIFVIEGRNDIKIYSNASIGITVYPHSATTATDLIRRADLAMYEAKHHGKNQIVIYDTKLETVVRNSYEIGVELREAIANNELAMVYQPQYDLLTKKMIGVEALVRWKSQKMGFIPPDVFIPIAEQHGLMRDLGAYIIDQTIDDFSYMREVCKSSGNLLQKMAINISPLQFNDPDFLYVLGDALLTYGVNAKYIEVEITETAMISSDQEAKRVNELINIGVRVAIDDFGTGYSSLSKLHSLPISTIKIDKAFIQTMLEDEKSESLVTSIVGLGENLGMCIVAEGVETKEQLAFLSEFDYGIIIQGYYYARPMNITNIIKLCKQGNAK